MKNIIDFIYPPSCSVCGKPGFYICPLCLKRFKRNIPECYLCRRVSNDFKTHFCCKNDLSLDSVFIAFEYNKLSSDILKSFKYKSVTDIQSTLVEIFYKAIINSSYTESLRGTLLIPVPISKQRMRDRGFNQTEIIAKGLSKRLDLDFENNLLKRVGNQHQALRDRDERLVYSKNPFSIKKRKEISQYSSITIVEDVITTGSTLHKVTEVIKKEYGENTKVQAICVFRGKPYYSETSV